MPQGFPAMMERARAAWGRLSRSQQVALITGVVISLALVTVFIFWSQQTNYGVLFSNLQAQDASAIVTKLKSDKIPYQITDNGTVIMVPSNMVDETRLMLAGDGLPNQGVVGFEIFDKTNPLGMTDFTQQLDYQRGLEGELTRTIQQISGVAAATVNIVLPQSSLYTSTQDNPTASIVVRMSPGSSLDPGQVKAIMHLVASAVQGLKPENVTIVDGNGNDLSASVNSTDLTGGLTATTYGTALDVEHHYEQGLSQQATSMLNTVLGAGKAVVRVNASLNWDQLQQDSTSYGQQPNQISSQSSSSTQSNSNGSSTSGIPGTGSNLVPTPTTTAGSNGQTYSQTQSNTVYDVSQTVAHLTRAPGSVQRLTVAVFLDGTYTPAQVTQIQQAVSDAIGLNSTRGDSITVSAIAFNHSTDVAAQNALKAQQQQSQFETLWRGGALAATALALLFFAWRATRRGKPRPTPMASVALVNDMVSLGDARGNNSGELQSGHMQDANGIMMTTDPTALLHAARQQQMTEAEKARALEVRDGLMEIARQQPEMLANVIQGWFDE